MRVSNWGLSPGDDCHVPWHMDRPGWTPDPPEAKAALIDVVPHQMSSVIGTLGPRLHRLSPPLEAQPDHCGPLACAILKSSTTGQGSVLAFSPVSLAPGYGQEIAIGRSTG